MTEPRMLCIGCHAPREVDVDRCTPGVIPYQPCPTCGSVDASGNNIGIYREADRYQELHRKKAFRLPYEKRNL